MKLDRLSYALSAAALIAVGLSACSYQPTRADAANSRQLAAAGEAPQRGPVQTASDATITAKVKAKLAADDLVKARNINVDTLRGVVQLNGTVNSVAEKAQALALARNTDGVIEVKDNLKLAG